MNTTPERGDLNRSQIQQLLHPINPRRVVTGAHVKPHLSQQDVLAHLTRVFGFGHFDVEVREVSCLFEEPTQNSKGNPAWNVGYRALVRLHIRNERQESVAYYDGGSTGESDGQPSRAASHDLAYKSALSTATKRAAIALGDQFGLSLYNKGQMGALVVGTMVGLAHDGKDMQAEVTQQEEDGGATGEIEPAEAAEPEEPTAKAPKRRQAAVGRQGARRKPEESQEPAPADEPPVYDDPEADAADEAARQEDEARGRPAVLDPSLDEERAHREADAAEQERIARAREEEPAADPATGEFVEIDPADWEARIQAATTEGELRDLWSEAAKTPAEGGLSQLTFERKQAIIERRQSLEAS